MRFYPHLEVVRDDGADLEWVNVAWYRSGVDLDQINKSLPKGISVTKIQRCNLREVMESDSILVRDGKITPVAPAPDPDYS